MPPRQAYVPPHLRNRETQGTGIRRTLDDIGDAGYWKAHITLPVFLRDALTNCPAEVLSTSTSPACSASSAETPVVADDYSTASSGHAGKAHDIVTATVSIPIHVDEVHNEVLDWLRHAVDNTDEKASVSLLLPTSLSKEQRKHWHKLAEWTKGHIQSTSQGVGDARQLQLTAKSEAQRIADSVVFDAGKHITAKAKQLWSWCQQEGGAASTVSQGEVQEMLDGTAPFLPDVVAVQTKRSHLRELFELVESGQEEALIERLRSLDDLQAVVWTKSEKDMYLLGVAMLKGMEDAALFIASSNPQVQHQRHDGLTTTQFAQQLGLMRMIEVLGGVSEGTNAGDRQAPQRPLRTPRGPPMRRAHAGAGNNNCRSADRW